MIELSKDLNLPVDAVTQTFGYSARKGAGKSYAASKVAEGMLAAGAQVIVFDPVGNWYGLRLTAAGKPSGLPIYIFGGEHADVPLDASGARDLARVLAAEPISAILDVSEMRKAERQRFCAQFAEEFFHQKKSHRTPVHLFLEEAQLFVPQQVQGDIASMVGAFEDIVRLGRNYGIGCSLISQRPQSVNKQVLSQVECLVVLQTTGPHERKAIDEWVSEHGVDRKLVGELPSLPVGTAYVWSPSWLRKFELVKITKKHTFDASSTPVVGGARQEPKRLAPADLEKLRGVMTDAVKKAEDSDPKKLKARIAELERAKSQPADSAVLTQLRSDLAVSRAEKQELQKLIDGLRNDVLRSRELLIKGIGALPNPENDFAVRPTEPPTHISVSAVPAQKKAGDAPVAAKVFAPTRQRSSHYGIGLTGPERKILNAIAWLNAVGIESPQQVAVAFVAGYTIGGGAFNNPRGALRTKGLIEYSGDSVRLTDEGRKVAEFPDEIGTADDLQRAVMERLPGPERKILQVLLDAYPKFVGNTDCAERAGYTPGGGAYNNPRGRLKSLGLIEYNNGELRAKPLLFLEA